MTDLPPNANERGEFLWGDYLMIPDGDATHDGRTTYCASPLSIFGLPDRGVYVYLNGAVVAYDQERQMYAAVPGRIHKD